MDEVKIKLPPYRITSKDFSALNTHVYFKRTSPITWLFLPVFMTLINLYIYFDYGIDWQGLFFVFVTWLIGWNLFFGFVYGPISGFLTRKQPFFLYDSTIEITNEKVHTTQIGNESIFLWKNLHSVERDKQRIYIFINKKCAFIVPTSVFATKDDEIQFFETSKSLLENAKK